MSKRRRDLDSVERTAQRALAPDHFRAWLALKRFGPLTAAQISRRGASKRDMIELLGVRSLHRRLSELRDAGWILEHGSTFCSKSHRHVLTWQALDKPRAFSKLERDEAGTVWFIAHRVDGARAFSRRRDAEAWGSAVIIARELRRYAAPCS